MTTATDLFTEWTAWHAAREEELRTPHGWLSLTALEWLDDTGGEVPEHFPHRRTVHARVGGGGHPGSFSPASMATASRFSSGGNGQVAYAVKAHGRFTVRLKSISTRPSASGSATRSTRPPP